MTGPRHLHIHLRLHQPLNLNSRFSLLSAGFFGDLHAFVFVPPLHFPLKVGHFSFNQYTMIDILLLIVWIDRGVLRWPRHRQHRLIRRGPFFFVPMLLLFRSNLSPRSFSHFRHSLFK